MTLKFTPASISSGALVCLVPCIEKPLTPIFLAYSLDTLVNLSGVGGSPLRPGKTKSLLIQSKVWNRLE